MTTSSHRAPFLVGRPNFDSRRMPTLAGTRMLLGARRVEAGMTQVAFKACDEKTRLRTGHEMQQRARAWRERSCSSAEVNGGLTRHVVGPCATTRKLVELELTTNCLGVRDGGWSFGSRDLSGEARWSDRVCRKFK